MFWSGLLYIVIYIIKHIFGPSIPALAPPSILNDIEPIFPKTWEERRQAREALHGDPQGDMRFDSDDHFGAIGERNTSYRWPKVNGVPEIPYVIGHSVSKLKPIILKAIAQYHNKTCIRFVKRKKQKDYVKIFKGDGCWSYIGKIGGNQSLSLGAGCEYVGSAVHELGHALGLYHEQQRSDRDNFITVNMGNVRTGFEGNFFKIPRANELTDTAYDCDSIMQYGEYAFSKNPNVDKTMTGKKSDCVLKEPYDKAGLTQRDILLLRQMYC